MKKLIVVLVVLFIGILFAGCTSQPAAPAATPTPTAVPTTVATPVPTAVPTTIATPNVTVNVTANVTAVPTAVPQKVVLITFTKDLTVTPDSTVYVPVGTKISWFNNDPFKPHGVQALNQNSGKYFGDLFSHSIPYHGFYNVTFDQKGSYDYATIFQPQIAAKIVVS